MGKTDELVRMFAADIENKDVLEVACGAAGFSVSAARIAHRAACIDLDDSRLNGQAKESKIHFQIMDTKESDQIDRCLRSGKNDLGNN